MSTIETDMTTNKSPEEMHEKLRSHVQAAAMESTDHFERNEAFSIMSLPPEIRSIIWSLVIFSEGPQKVIGGPYSLCHPTADMIDQARQNIQWHKTYGFRDFTDDPADLAGWRPRRAMRKYKLPRARRGFREQMTSAELHLTNQLIPDMNWAHPLSLAFTCRAWYLEIAPLYYRSIEHSVPWPYNSHCDYRGALAMNRSALERFPMIAAIGESNARHIQKLTFRHVVVEDLAQMWVRSRLGMEERTNEFMDTITMRLLHLSVVELQSQFPNRPRIVNEFADRSDFKLIIDHDQSATRLIDGKICHRLSFASCLKTLWTTPLLPYKPHGPPDPRVRNTIFCETAFFKIFPHARLGRNHQIYVSEWGKMLKEKASLLLQDDDVQEIKRFFEASLSETRGIYCDTAKGTAFLMFYAKKE